MFVGRGTTMVKPVTDIKAASRPTIVKDMNREDFTTASGRGALGTFLPIVSFSATFPPFLPQAFSLTTWFALHAVAACEKVSLATALCHRQFQNRTK
jgi:hypothetical protein